MDINAAFKLFDVRGLYPQEVDERMAFLVGKALSLQYNPKNVLVASDTRESSPTLKNFLVDGLSLNTKNIFDLFEIPMPQFYFTLAKDNYDLGVMVTASHISDLENGFKFASRGGLPFDQEEIITLKNKVTEITQDQIVVPHPSSQRINNTKDYVAHLLDHTSLKKVTSKIILDVTRSSVVTPVLVIFSQLKANFELVNSDHSGNPLLSQNRIAIAKKVQQSKADLGILWDSDGDRVIFVDRNGQLIPPSFVLGILGAQAVKKGLGKKVVIDVRAGLVVRDLVYKAGGEVEIVPSWAQFIKFAMKKDSQIGFGGENSGHLVFRDFYCIDDGLLGSLRFLESWENDNLEELLNALNKRYFELPEMNFPSDPENSVTLLENLTNHYRGLGYQISIEDGLTVFGPDFKFNLRQSVTEPFLRLNLESSNENTASKVSLQIKNEIGLR